MVRRSTLRALIGRLALPALAVLGVSATAHAQADLNAPLPNVLLLVDTSGSMEFKTDGSPVTCNPGNTMAVNDRSRWIDLVEVLTGTIENYSCQELERSSTAMNEYKLGGSLYDDQYPIPYHRPLSGGCAPAPGVQSSNPFIYPGSGAVSYHTYNGASACTFQQRSYDGILDTFRDYVRFGLMTFDTSTDPGTGYNGDPLSASANLTTGRTGLWSYIVGSAASGKPAGCATATDQEVGARNAAAPPWEGRMVNFGNPLDGVGAHTTKNAHIQEILLATRPYGATPIAGMLHDAKTFLLDDDSKDPDPIPASSTGLDFGPRNDPFLKCDPGRKQAIILLTDGQPNLDLRPYCADNTELPAGQCPFDLPETIAADLNTQTATHDKIPTYVVGFALDQVDDDNDPSTPALDCSEITEQDVDESDSTSLCGNPANAGNQPLQACCTLQRIALAGGHSAYFANNREMLRSQLSEILSSTQSATSRTQPVASGGGRAADSTFRFFSGFKTATLSPWQGTLTRQRFACDADGADAAAGEGPDPSKGDDFVHNVAVGGPDARRVYTVLGGATSSETIDSSATIRPNIGSSDPDGVGTYGGRYYSGLSAAFITDLPTAATAIPTASCVSETGASLTATQCRDMYLKWWLGYDNGQSSVKSRCPSVDQCALVGDIIHSTPVVVDRPGAALRDESYARFSLLQATRPLVLYVSTNDGLLHAFKVTSNDPADFDDDAKMVRNDSGSNELWTFAPPAVLPNLYHLYPYNHQALLDGTPVVQDVVARQPDDDDEIPTVFERTAEEARAGAAAWRTVLVQSFGASHSGYFALDVTTPVPSATNPDDPTQGGPRMLWQLTRAGDDNLFGRGGATPGIVTLFVDPEGGTNPREIPVAVLPGGPGGTPISGGTGCPASGRSFSDVSIDSSFPPRSKVRCYDYSSGNAELGARSLTIVRLDTGEIIRTFRQDKDEVPTALQDRTTEADIDSPITGQPVGFPGFVGQVADRIFVGDADGRLWKVDVSSSNPADWTMKLFFDLYPAAFASAGGRSFDEGQPIELTPVVTVDDEQNLVLLVASGDQNNLGAVDEQYNYLYSLTEQRTSSGFTTKVNWYKQFEGGERVLGPLVLFNKNLYFSSYAPYDGSDVCAVGTSRIWGQDDPNANPEGNYLLPKDKDDLSQGGLGLTALESVSAVSAGVAVVKQPDCTATDTDATGDPVLGFGKQIRFSHVNTGKFQLLFQTGNNTSDTEVAGASVGVKTIDLQTPRNLSSIESWASIVE